MAEGERARRGRPLTPPAAAAAGVLALAAAWGGWTAQQDWRAIEAEARIEAWRQMPALPAAIGQLATVEALTTPATSVYLLEMRSAAHHIAARRAATPAARAAELAAAEAALAQAAARAPGRPSLWVRRAHVAFDRFGGTRPDVHAYLAAARAASPHGVQGQPLRLALGLAAWETARPDDRRGVMADLRDVCMRYGMTRTLRLVDANGAPSARFAARVSLALAVRTCPDVKAGPADIPI